MGAGLTAAAAAGSHSGPRGRARCPRPSSWERSGRSRPGALGSRPSPGGHLGPGAAGVWSGAPSRRRRARARSLDASGECEGRRFAAACLARASGGLRHPRRSRLLRRALCASRRETNFSCRDSEAGVSLPLTRSWSRARGPLAESCRRPSLAARAYRVASAVCRGFGVQGWNQLAWVGRTLVPCLRSGDSF